MENYKEIVDAYRRASLASVVKVEEPQDKDDKLKPKDTFHLVHVLCLFLGLTNVLPMPFFITANSYWMYKFRDIAKDEIDLNNKTTLQTYFTSGLTVVQAVPSVVFMLLSTTMGHRFKVYPRMVVTLAVQICVFAIFTMFIKVNTDSWQLGFFIMTLLGISFLTGFLNLFQVTTLAVVPKFPQIYMKTFLFGQGTANLFSALLQVTSLAIGTSTEASALLYFISGTLVICFTFILYLVSQHLKFYQHYMNVVLEDVKKKHSKAEVKSVFFKIWPILAVSFVVFVTMAITHPGITTLVVSEYYGKGNKWNDVYFVPVITFLFTEVCSMMGRLLATPMITKKNGPWVVGLVILRMIILVPLVLLSNAQPRHHLPVLLKHDWQYILLCVVYFTSLGYLMNGPFLSVPQLASGDDDVAYRIMMSLMGLSGGLLSPFGVLAVRML